MRVRLLIGADRGIGRCIASALHERGDRVVAACLGDGEELKARGIAVEPFVDVTSDEAVDTMAASLEAAGAELDWLFHIAGVLALDDLDTVDFNEVRREFEINAIGPLRVAKAVASRLAEGAKVGIVTSRVG